MRATASKINCPLFRWIGLSALDRLGCFHSWGVAPGLEFIHFSSILAHTQANKSGNRSVYKIYT
jgi:hypothetical protein